LLENGEDEIIYCSGCDFAQNREINKSKEGDLCPKCKKPLLVDHAAEVGNIFKLNTKYSDPFSLKYKDKDGNLKTVIMGCYGIGVSRLMGVLAEIFNDERGLLWPESVAPFKVHLIALTGSDKKESKKVFAKANAVYQKLLKLGVEVLFDDRIDKSAGEKFAESDLIGIPLRLVISSRTGSKIEFKKRSQEKVKLVDFSYIKKYLLSE